MRAENDSMLALLVVGTVVLAGPMLGALFRRVRPRRSPSGVVEFRRLLGKGDRRTRRWRPQPPRISATSVGLLVLVLAGGGYWAYMSYAPRGLLEAVDSTIGWVSGGEVLVAKVGVDRIRVRDGDTIELTGRPVRFQGVNCPEIGQPGAGPARDLLVRTLAASAEVTCRLNGERTYDRTVGRCAVDGADLGMTLIEAGVCGRCAAYDRSGYYARVSSAYAGPVPGYCTAF